MRRSLAVAALLLALIWYTSEAWPQGPVLQRASPAYYAHPNVVKFTNPLATLAVGNGGTAVSSYTIGDLLYASGTAALATLSDVATGSVLVSGGVGVAPAWSASPTVTTVTVGTATPTALTNIRIYTPTLTPAQLAAAVGVTEQTFTVTGLTTADKVLVNGPAPTALCPPVTYRVSAADTIAIGFADLTVALCTPAAGTYTILAVRS